MTMKRRYANIIKVLLLLVIVVVVVVANVLHRQSAINSVVVVVDYMANDTLVTSEQLSSSVMEKYRDITNQAVGSADLEGIRQVVKSNQFVDEADVSVTVSSDLMIKVTQRTPLVRVYSKKSQFYLDTKGRYMPISQINNQRVIVANGYIKKDFSGNIASLDIEALVAANPKAENYDITKIFRLAKYINNDKNAKVLFDQIYLNSNGDMEIVPKLGNHTVVLGDINNLDEKFENLFALYQKGFSKTGWEKYSSVNLKFKDQIICTKKQ